jgi:glycosyltransferase involved in cell wall biosynthesis
MHITMKNIIPSNSFNVQQEGQLKHPINGRPSEKPGMVAVNQKINPQNDPLSEILVLSSYPPRKCGIATYSQDLIKALNNKFRSSFSLKICALESGFPKHKYSEEVKYTLDTSIKPSYEKLAKSINQDELIKIVLVQHEFGFFMRHEDAFINLLNSIFVPVVVVFHTVLLNPGAELKKKVQKIVDASASIIVMTKNSSQVLEYFYDVPKEKISVIPHGTHLVTHPDKDILKEKYSLAGRKVLSTFGLLGSGKKIETTLEALPQIARHHPDIIFLIIGKTHPEVLKNEGEQYRSCLESMVKSKNLGKHVKFINSYVTLPLLLEYLQLTDIYLFTSNDPNQAVSGTFVYAMSCGCPIISTPIPHARELLTEDTGIIVDYLNSNELSEAVNRLLKDESLRKKLSLNSLQTIVPTAWENSAVAHANLFENIAEGNISIRYNLPVINLNHIRRMTTDIGIIQFSKINEPDIGSGYTLDDNARALVAICMNFKLTGNKANIDEINKYLIFIKYCLQPAGNFLNYVDSESNFTSQNYSTNLDDANGRAIWALGYLVSLNGRLPDDIITEAINILEKALVHAVTIYSPRAMAFTIKGLYYYNRAFKTAEDVDLVKLFANRLAHLFKHESDKKWTWFEDSLTYANSILPEAMMYAWLLTGDNVYRDYSTASLDFLLSKTFREGGMEVISNKGWLHRDQKPARAGEQPIDVAYTVMTLSKFYDAFGNKEYLDKLEIAFNWFLGKNRLQHIVYNPATGGCYDGLEDTHVNLNQGAESTISYLMARITVGKYKLVQEPPRPKLRVHPNQSQQSEHFVSFNPQR